MNKTDTGVHKRETWASQFGLIMSMAGMSIGLGNVWRFPYMVGAYGGGAFLLAYLICVIAVVLPLAFIEVGMGKFVGRGLMETFTVAFRGNKVLGRIYGGFSSFVYFAMNFYYLLVLGSVAIAIFTSATGAWNRMPADQIYDHYYSNKPLMAVMVVVMALLLSFIVYKGISEGIEKVSKVMVPLIFVFFGIVIVFTIFTVDGIGAGYDYYLNPDFSVLGNFEIWIAAMGQALFSVGVGPGALLIYGSHMKRKSEVPLTVTTIVALDTCAALFAGMVIIPACVALGLNPESGAKLIFVVLPSVFQSLPLGNIIGLLVFLAIFFAGLTSAIAQLEVAITTFSDGFNWTRTKTVLVFTVITFIFAIPAVFNQTMYNFWNEFAGNWGFIVTAAIGAIAFNWVYGTKKVFSDSIIPGSALKLPAWITPYTKFIAVTILVVIMANSLFPFL